MIYFCFDIATLQTIHQLVQVIIQRTFTIRTTVKWNIQLLKCLEQPLNLMQFLALFLSQISMKHIFCKGQLVLKFGPMLCLTLLAFSNDDFYILLYIYIAYISWQYFWSRNQSPFCGISMWSLNCSKLVNTI